MYLYSLYLMAVLYILAGMNHFRVPAFYQKLMPPYIPFHREMVFLSGAVEVALGVLLMIPESRSMAAWLIILMLAVFMTVHVYMVQERSGVFKDIHPALLWGRLPLQFVLAAWAYLYI